MQTIYRRIIGCTLYLCWSNILILKAFNLIYLFDSGPFGFFHSSLACCVLPCCRLKRNVVLFCLYLTMLHVQMFVYSAENKLKQMEARKISRSK